MARFKNGRFRKRGDKRAKRKRKARRSNRSLGGGRLRR